MEGFAGFLQAWGALILAAASLLIAIISLAKAAKSQKIQNQVNQIELHIKQYELDKIAKEKREAARSCVEARVIHIAKNSWKLRIWNSGNTTVFNVTAAIEKDAEIILLDSKMPFEVLEPNKSFDENIIVHMGSARKFRITTAWQDDKGNADEKVQIVSL